MIGASAPASPELGEAGVAAGDGSAGSRAAPPDGPAPSPQPVSVPIQSTALRTTPQMTRRPVPDTSQDPLPREARGSHRLLQSLLTTQTHT